MWAIPIFDNKETIDNFNFALFQQLTANLLRYACERKKIVDDTTDLNSLLLLMLLFRCDAEKEHVKAD